MNISLLFLLGLMPGTSFSFNFFFSFLLAKKIISKLALLKKTAQFGRKKKERRKASVACILLAELKSFLVPESIRFRIFFISRGVSAFVQRQLIVYINNYILKECCIPLFFSSLFFVFVKKH